MGIHIYALALNIMKINPNNYTWTINLEKILHLKIPLWTTSTSTSAATSKPDNWLCLILKEIPQPFEIQQHLKLNLKTIKWYQAHPS